MEIIELFEAYNGLKSAMNKCGINDGNIQQFAKYFAYWTSMKKCRIPCEKAKMVYQSPLDGTLVSLPFVEIGLKNYHIGFQIDNLCCVIQYAKQMSESAISDFLKEITARLNRKVRLFTLKEADEYRFLLYKETPKGLVYKKEESHRKHSLFCSGELLCQDYGNGVGDSYSDNGGLWWAANKDELKKVLSYHEFIKNQTGISPYNLVNHPDVLQKLVEDSETALAYPIFDLEPANTVYGTLDKDGIPTEETLKLLEKYFK